MNLTQLSRDELGGNAACAYKVSFINLIGAKRLEIDRIGLGPYGFIDSGVAGSNPLHAYETKGLKNDGLRLAVTRPLGATPGVPIGNWAAITLGRTYDFPNDFLLYGAFNRPRQIRGGQFVAGNFAASVLLNISGTTKGVTCQFTTLGIRLNLGGMGLALNRPTIDPALSAKIFDPTDPKPIALVLSVKLTTSDRYNSTAFFYVGNNLEDTVQFDFPGLAPSTHIRDVRFGIATASGVDYRASLRALGFQIWLPRI